MVSAIVARTQALTVARFEARLGSPSCQHSRCAAAVTRWRATRTPCGLARSRSASAILVTRLSAGEGAGGGSAIARAVIVSNTVAYVARIAAERARDGREEGLAGLMAWTP